MITPTPANLPERAENLANQILHGIAALRHAASELEVKASSLYILAKEVTSADLIPRGFDIEDIPDHPGIQVIYDPTDGESFHCIACRGLDISGAVSSLIEDAAMEIVRDAHEKHLAERSYEEQQTAARLDAQDRRNRY